MIEPARINLTDIRLLSVGVLYVSGLPEQLPAAAKKFLLDPFAQESITSDPDKPLGNDMQQEAVHELRSRQGDVFPGESCAKS